MKTKQVIVTVTRSRTEHYVKDFVVDVPVELSPNEVEKMINPCFFCDEDGDEMRARGGWEIEDYAWEDPTIQVMPGDAGMRSGFKLEVSCAPIDSAA